MHTLQGDKETDPGTEAGMTFPLADTALIAYSFPPALSPPDPVPRPAYIVFKTKKPVHFARTSKFD